MRKNISFEHLLAWGRWTSVNLILATKDQDQAKSKKRTIVGYGAITDHFGNTTHYKKDDAGHKQFMEDLLLFVAKTYICISIVEN
jgi:hypothetical protein